MGNNLKALRKLCILMGASVLLQGCGDTPNKKNASFTDPVKRETRPNPIEEKIKQRAAVKYMLDNTFSMGGHSSIDGSIGGPIYHSGKLSVPFKKTMQGLFNALGATGFSGYRPVISDNYVSTRYRHAQISWDVSQPQRDRDLQNNILDYLVGVNAKHAYKDVEYASSLQYTSTLIGLMYKDQALMLVRSQDKQPKLVLANAFREKVQDSDLPLLDAETDVPVTDAQIAEWNKIFVDTFKDDAELMAALEKDNSRAADIESGLRDITSRVLLTPKTDGGVDASALRVNGELGMRRAAFNLPVSFEVLGDVRSNAINQLLAGRLTYMFSNGVYMGGVHAYEETALSTQHEHSVAMGYMGANVLLEAQAGCVKNNNTVFNLSNTGARYQLMGAYTLTEGVMPFVQSVYQNFIQTSKLRNYVGVQLNKELHTNADTSVSLQAAAKWGVGEQSYGENNLRLTAKLAHAGFYFFDITLEVSAKESKVSCSFEATF